MKYSPYDRLVASNDSEVKRSVSLLVFPELKKINFGNSLPAHSFWALTSLINEYHLQYLLRSPGCLERILSTQASESRSEKGGVGFINVRGRVFDPPEREFDPPEREGWCKERREVVLSWTPAS